MSVEEGGPATAEYLQVALRGPEPAALADMASVGQDLAFARDAALQYAAMAEVDELTDSLLAKALWNAAAISYRRSFTSGKAMLAARRPRLRLDRKALAESDELSQEQRDAHVLTLTLADKHVAHRVDEVEDARVLALLAPPPAPRGVEGLGVMSLRMAGPAPQVARDLADLCDLLMTAVQAEFTERHERLLADLHRTQDVDQYYDAPRRGHTATTRSAGRRAVTSRAEPAVRRPLRR